MKNRIAIIVLLALFASVDLFAQTALSDSKRQSSELYIYKIGRDDLRKIHLKEKKPDEAMLQSFVRSYTRGTKQPELPRGNYVVVGSAGEQLVYNDLTVDDFNFKIVSGEQVMLLLYDSLGNTINNAKVKCGASSLKFDKKTQTYNTGKVKNEQVIEVDNDGVLHYIEIEKDKPYAYKANFFRKTQWKVRHSWNNIKEGVAGIFDPDGRPERNKYTGFVVFNKPKYKSGETVKFKAYMTTYDGKLHDKPVIIRLHGDYPDKIDTTLIANLKPYRPGMYQGEFTLSDRLNLKLDAHYTVALKTGKKRDNELRGNFYYEEYELKSTRFSASIPKEKYAAGDTVKLTLKATDENNMALYGGRVEILVTPKRYGSLTIQGARAAFIPDTLWTTTIAMNEVSEKDVVLPDSLFPQTVSMHCEVQCTYLSADNEKMTEIKSFFRNANEYAIDFSLEKGILTINERHKGKPQQVSADILISGKNDETLLKETVMLPHTVTVPWVASDIFVKTENTKDFYFLEDVNDDQLSYKFHLRNDSIYLQVDNPSDIPFWYTVRKGKKNIVEGYATQLHYAMKDKDYEGYSMSLSYVFGGKSKRIEGTLPYVQKNMNINIATPTVVYPGQKANITVSVTDKKGQPVENADITAYSFTSKFPNYSMPNLAVKGTSHYAKQFDNTRYEPDENGIYNQKSRMTWERWKHSMSLDTMEYYKFLYPDVYYSYAEPTADGTTQIAPYVVINGVLQGVQMLWIDGQLHYTRQAQQAEIYTFRLPFSVFDNHNLRIRTYDREIMVFNIFVKQGCKNIFSFDADTEFFRQERIDYQAYPLTISSKLLKKRNRGMLTNSEVEELNRQLITVNNNFGRIIFPNLHQYVELPAYISAGNMSYYLNPTTRTYYDWTLRGTVNAPILAGPFPHRDIRNGMANIVTVYVDGKPIVNTQIEGGYQYTLYKNYQKLESWKDNPVSKNIVGYTPEPDFSTPLLTEKRIIEDFNRKILSTLTSGSGSIEKKLMGKEDAINTCRLELSLLYNKNLLSPTLIVVTSEDKDDIRNYRLYYGGTRHFINLPEGNMNVHLVFADTTSLTTNLTLHKNGRNYLQIDSLIRDTDKSFAQGAFKRLQQYLGKTTIENPYAVQEIDKQLKPVQQTGIYNQSNSQKGVVTGVVRDEEGEPLVGAIVRIKGSIITAIADINGRFELAGGAENDKIEITSMGCETVEVNYQEGFDYNIVLKYDAVALEEVVVGYGVSNKSTSIGSVAVIEQEDLANSYESALQGRVAGVMIRGVSSISEEGNPLIIINGLPYNGKLEDLDPGTIVSMNILKGQDATAIYGSRAANGVIMLQTNAVGAVGNKHGQQMETDGIEPGNSMRRNFHDDAFWQPSLRTNEKGEASFEVTYPDDITSWNAYFLAIGNRKQADKKQLTIQSFKALTARLSMPRFAIRGDSLNAIGRIANHLNDSIQVQQAITVENRSQAKEIGMSASHVEQIPVSVSTGDSVTVSYSLQTTNGYFDGEERTIPVFEQGMLQTNGEFKVINDTIAVTFNINPNLGTTTLHAEATSMELFLREIEKIDRYPYYCNEQMASKIKALLSKKRMYEIFGKTFKDDRKINNLIGRLERNCNADGLWGWWNNDKTEFWISSQIVNALLDAETAGYKTNIDKPKLRLTLQKDLDNSLAVVPMATPRGIPFAKQELLERLILLKRLGATLDYEAYYSQINHQLKASTLTDKLKEMLLLSTLGLNDKINIDTLMHYVHPTLLGSLYWGEKEEKTPLQRFLLPHATNTENTLTVYRILKNLGRHEAELVKIRNYFFERHSAGSWQNIYESSRIIENILPDMLDQNAAYSEVFMTVNGRVVSRFPYTDKITTQQPIQIKKTGTLPLFVTTYQQEWNHHPQPESGKGFAVHTCFKENKDTVSLLTAGKIVNLEVTVNVDATAEYVQIEVPIPAGCTYESKNNGYYGNEAHREYFKEKVVIFSNRLTKGEHTFIIELIPRFTGKYTLNPAKAELMYFPTFYGNEKGKEVEVKE